MSDITQRVLKVIAIIFAFYFVSEIIFSFFPEDNIRVIALTGFLPAIATMYYAYKLAQKEDYLSLKVVFIMMIVGQLYKLVDKII